MIERSAAVQVSDALSDTPVVMIVGPRQCGKSTLANQFLEGRKYITLDDPVARHVPEFAAGGKGAVTIRHLLTHTGGFRMLDVGFPREPWAAILARVCAARLEPRCVPGREEG